MRLIVLERKKIVLFTCWLLLVLLGAGLATYWSQAKRQWFGVKDGVTLEGHSMARLLPEEVRKVVTEMAKFYTIEPRNAGYFAETGEIIPEKDGLGVDIEATINNVLSAAPGESLSLVTYALPATVSKDYFSPVFQGPATKQQVSLAINVAWGEEELPALLSILKQYGVKATFFFDGAWVKKFPEMVRWIAADGHEIANHGLYHGHPTRMSKEELRRLVLENDRLLAEVIGGEPAKLFAPPYGEFNDQVVAVAAELGFRTIMWTIDTIDWQRPAPEVIIRRVVEKLKPGAIILMHPTVPTVQALESILTQLREEGYAAVTVSTLLRSD